MASAAAAVVVASASPAEASAPSVLILSTSVSGGTSSVEYQQATALGFTATVATPTSWDAMTTAQFANYSAIVIGDPSSGGSCATSVPTDALSTAAAWGSAISGNVAVLGTAPVLGGATALIKDAIAYAAAGTGTGLYVSLNCEYRTASAGSLVSLLTAVDGGGFTVTGQGSSCPSNAGTINTWQAVALTQFNGLASSDLGPWSSPACSVEESFNAWPAGLNGLAYDIAATPATFTASDGATGQAYVLAGAPVPPATAALAQTVGGQVPAQTAAPTGINPAAPGVNQQPALGVNTENGDYGTSGTDFTIPTFGPPLDFTRTYDAQAAQQQTQTGTPGPMGYGWTDDWASSLSPASPVIGDVYSLDGLATPNGNGGPATGGPLDFPDMSRFNNGDLYISDTAGNRIEEIPGSNGTQWGIPMLAGDMYTIAGSPTGAYEVHPTPNGTVNEDPNGGPSSLLNHPEGIVFDSAGDLYIADTGDNRVVEIPVASGTQWGTIVMTANDLYNIAGNSGGTSGSSGDGSLATSAFLNAPVGMDWHGSDLYIADAGNNRIQEVPGENGGQWGQTSMTANDMYTVAGSPAGTPGASLNGTLAENANGQGDASLLDGPEGVAFSGAGDMYIADTTNSRIVEIPKASGTQWAIPMTANDLYTVAGAQQNGTQGTTGDGGLATAALLNEPVAVRVLNGGQLYISDSGNNRIQEVARTGHTEWNIPMTINDIYTIAGSASGTAGFSGDGGLATAALLNNPGQVAMDGSGNMYIADTNNNREREVSSSTWKISEFAGDGQTLASMGDGGPAIDGELFRPAGQAEDASGNIYISDSGNNRIQEIAATTHSQWNISMTAGDVYTVAGSQYGLGGYSGDGGRATSALLSSPEGIAVDAAGDIFIADRVNNRIREVNASTGFISTIAGTGTDGISGNTGPATQAQLENPQNVAVDSAGDVFIADNQSNEVREVFAPNGNSYGQTMTAGDIYRIAGSLSGAAGTSGDGGPATASLLDNPRGVAVDGANNLYIADTLNNRIQEIPATTGMQRGQQMTQYDIYTIAGSASGSPGSSGDGGSATAALLQQPYGLASDSAGDLFIADGQNNRIQEVPAANGTQWGTSMTGNDMYTVAGSANGTKGETGDGGPATGTGGALMSFAIDVSVDNHGNLYISDWAGNHLREVTATTATTISPAFPTVSALYPAPGGLTLNEPGGGQVTFYAQSNGNCSNPYITTGQYCALKEFRGSSLTFSSASNTYTFSPQPHGGTLTYSSSGSLLAVTSTTGDALTASAGPAPGSGNCPASASSCQTLTSASGRALTIGYNGASMVSSVTDPMGRRWTYGYTNGDLTTVTDPSTNVTTYGYGAGTTGNPLNANNLTSITDPNEQTGGPDAGTDTSITYFASGQVKSITDPMGNTTSFTWTSLNPATGSGFTTAADPDGNKAVYYYTQGTLAAQSAWTGGTMTNEQDYVPDQTAAAGDNSAGTQLDTVTSDGGGQIARTSYDANGNMVSTTSPAGTMTEGTDSSGDVNCGTDLSTSSACSQSAGPPPVAPGGVITPPPAAPPPGTTWSLFDTSGNQLYETTGVYEPGSSTAAYSQTTYQLFKGNSITLNGRNISCASTPPSTLLPCATIDENAVVTQLAYDAQGDLTSSSTPDGNPNNEVAQTTYSYDGDGAQTSATSPDGNVSGATPATTANNTTVTTYNADGQPTSVTEAGGSGATATPRITSYGYDANGNQTSVTDARGFKTTTTYNADDEATLVTDPNNNSELTCYDGVGRITQTVPPISVAANSLTPSSCPSAYPAGYGQRLAGHATTYTYDGNGDLTQKTTPTPAGQPGPETTSYAYDSAGNLITTTEPPTVNGGPNQVTKDTYNSAGGLASETTGYGTSAASTVSYCYDPDGDLTSIVYPDGNTNGVAQCETSSPWAVSSTAYPTQAANQTTYSLDSVAETVSVTRPATTADPHGATTTFTYDPVGQLLTSTDPNGVIITRTYTPEDNEASVSYSSSSAHSATYGYDADGNMTSMADAPGTSAYTYDPFGELTSATNGAGQTLGYGYDADGNATAITYPLPAGATWASSDTVNYTYNNADLLTKVTDFNGKSIAIGNTGDSMPNSESLGSTGDTITPAYDHNDIPSSITLQNATSTLQSFTYSDAPASTILTECDTTPSCTQPSAAYTYDAKARVTSMTPAGGSTQNYGFDASGNLTILPTGANATNGYDNSGELTSSVLGGSTTSYTYDADGNRLITAQGGTTITSGTWNGARELTSYTSPAGTMTGAVYDGEGFRTAAMFTPSGGSPVSESYVWDPTSGTPSLLMDSANAYIYGDGGTPAEQVNLTNGTATYLVTDSLGSVRGTVNSSGTLTGTTSYDAWGNPSAPGGLTAKTPFGYAGSYTDPTGLDYLINRYYDPATGQFTSLDPLVDQTLQPYAYTAGDPLSQTDPTGLDGGGAESQPAHDRQPAPEGAVPDWPGPTIFLWLHRFHDIAVATAAFNLAFVYHKAYNLSGHDLVKAFWAEHYVPNVSKNGKEKYGRADLTFAGSDFTDVWEIKSKSYKTAKIIQEVDAYCDGFRKFDPGRKCFHGRYMDPPTEDAPTPVGMMVVWNASTLVKGPCDFGYGDRCGAIKYSKMSLRKIDWKARPRTVPVRVMVHDEVGEAARQIALAFGVGVITQYILKWLAEWVAEEVVTGGG